MRLRLMEHSLGAEEGLFDENKFSAAVASLTLTFCRGCGSDINTDDILVILMRQLNAGTSLALPDGLTLFSTYLQRLQTLKMSLLMKYIGRCL